MKVNIKLILKYNILPIPKPNNAKYCTMSGSYVERFLNENNSS